MLPAFDDYGNLPSGIHRCTFDEVVERFGSESGDRAALLDELGQFITWAKRAGVRRLIVNGSFVTGKLSPNDVDIVIVPGPDYPRGLLSEEEDEIVWPFLQIILAADDEDLDRWISREFATDRKRRPKGVVEVIL
jgi:hypothetical protein